MNFIHIGMPLEHAVLLMNVSYEYEDLALKNIKIVNHIELLFIWVAISSQIRLTLALL